MNTLGNCKYSLYLAVFPFFSKILNVLNLEIITKYTLYNSILKKNNSVILVSEHTHTHTYIYIYIYIHIYIIYIYIHIYIYIYVYKTEIYENKSIH